MSASVSVEDVRRICGLSSISTDPDYVSDSDIQYFINRAKEMYRKHVTVFRLFQSAEYVNQNCIKVQDTPIADWDMDGTVSPSDLRVEKWTPGTPSTFTTLSVSSIDADRGLVYLKDTVSSTDTITVTYHFHPFRIDRTLERLALAYLAGYLTVMNRYLLIPERFAHGAVRFTHARPYLQLLERYHDTLQLMKEKGHLATEFKKPTKLRGESVGVSS